MRAKLFVWGWLLRQLIAKICYPITLKLVVWQTAGPYITGWGYKAPPVYFAVSLPPDDMPKGPLN